ncbi:MAG: xanthine dehydrogenase family protein molybdopterin-binding subunit, partial [Alphaproteobacteria bacterium]
MSSGQPSRRNDCMRPAKFGFGQPVRRKEDEAFLRGSGRYVADFAPQGLCHAAVLRSPHAHARFRIENAAAARGMPGVRLVLTAADVAELGFLPCTASVPDQTIAVPPYPIVANGEALHVGDCLAFVVADTLFQAQDAVEAIALDWEALPCVVDGRAALAEGAPRVATGRAGNLAYETSIGDAQATRSAFAAARHRVSLNLVNQRLVANYLDTRGVIGEYDPARDRITLTLSSQGGHAVR